MLIITSDIRTDGGTQPRGRLDDAVVQRYAEEMQAGLWDFSKSSAPLTAFHDGENYWLGDGFHRVAAAKKARLDEVEVDVRQGGQRDAILFSVGANATHGLPWSNDDKRRAVSRILHDPEWSRWSDREIARRCHVDHRFVAKLRERRTGDVPSERTYKTKHGTVTTMDTAAIGKARVSPAPPNAAKVEMAGGPIEEGEWSVPEDTTSGGRARAQFHGAASLDACAAHVDAIGDLRIDASLPGCRAADAAADDRGGDPADPPIAA